MDGRRVGQILMVREWDSYGWSEGGADIDGQSGTVMDGRRVGQTNMNGQRVGPIWMFCEWGRERGNVDEWADRYGCWASGAYKYG